jgi:trans-aconitate 2-methyltransferase
MAVWSPATYLQFADERSRPFWDLVARVGARDPSTVVDLGCGPGALTAGLRDRWPSAHVVGIDSSPQMIEAAQQHRRDGVDFVVGDVADWRPERRVDVVVSNATLQWVPGHRLLLPALLANVVPSGWFAFAVPGNFAEPTHQLLRELAADARFARFTEHLLFPSSYDPHVYYDDLHGLGCVVDAWESTYLHLLTGPDPVYRWISGTGARPVLQSLPEELRPEFVADYQSLLRAAYPETSYGTLLPFRRVFVVARKGPS